MSALWARTHALPVLFARIPMAILHVGAKRDIRAKMATCQAAATSTSAALERIIAGPLSNA